MCSSSSLTLCQKLISFQGLVSAYKISARGPPCSHPLPPSPLFSSYQRDYLSSPLFPSFSLSLAPSFIVRACAHFVLITFLLLHQHLLPRQHSQPASLDITRGVLTLTMDAKPDIRLHFSSTIKVSLPSSHSRVDFFPSEIDYDFESCQS